jgi:hypothetical protein
MLANDKGRIASRFRGRGDRIVIPTGALAKWRDLLFLSPATCL